MSQFADQARIKVRSGDGGNGMVAWRREKYEPLGGPAGGNGGRGGSIFIEADNNANTLLEYRYKSFFEAEPGARGGPKGMHGRAGKDVVLKVPPGTVVKDLSSGLVIADLVTAADLVLVAEGGKGGRGNAQLATPVRRAPHFCEPGESGIARELELELKLLADVGIAGLPNAGKSTLLSIMTAARPKIAAYPFSTLEPNLGMVKKPDGDAYIMADIPGLIEGAHRGAGLGHKFLKHIERTRLLLHMVDASSEHVVADIATTNNELSLYNKKLAILPQILVLNKSDLLSPAAIKNLEVRIQDNISKLYAAMGSVPTIVHVSCATLAGIDQLRSILLTELQRLPVPDEVHEVSPDPRAVEHGDQDFSVGRYKDRFIVSGTRAERLVATTNLRDPEALYHMYAALRRMGVVDELLAQGIEPGTEVVVGKTSFTFGLEP